MSMDRKKHRARVARVRAQQSQRANCVGVPGCGERFFRRHRQISVIGAHRFDECERALACPFGLRTARGRCM